MSTQTQSAEAWALVTGAGRGIGRAIAVALAQHGYAVALAARSMDQLEQAADKCLAAGAPTASLHSLDLAEPAAVEELLQALRPSCIDVLVNNAGTGALGNATSGDPDEWERLLALNLLTPMRLTRRLAPAMVERQRGTIINIGSIAAIEGMTSTGAYAASKHGLRGWSLSCYEHLRAHGIKVVLVNPAFVNTAMVAGAKGVNHERMLTADDVAQAAMLAVTTSPMCCPQEITLRLTKLAYG